jgi:hypothetical protein
MKSRYHKVTGHGVFSGDLVSEDKDVYAVDSLVVKLVLRYQPFWGLLLLQIYL